MHVRDHDFHDDNASCCDFCLLGTGIALKCIYCMRARLPASLHPCSFFLMAVVSVRDNQSTQAISQFQCMEPASYDHNQLMLRLAASLSMAGHNMIMYLCSPVNVMLESRGAVAAR